MKNLMFIIRQYKSSFLFLMFLGLVSNAIITLLNPLFLKYIFDEGVIKKNFQLFILMSVGFITLATFWRFFNMAHGLYLQKLKNNILKNLTTNMLKKYYRLSYMEVINKDTGYYSSRIYDEPLTASGTTLDITFDIGNAILTFLVSFCLIIFLSPKATAMLCLSVPFLMFLSKHYGTHIKRHSNDEKESEGRLRGMITKSVQSYKTVNMFGLGSRIFEYLNIYFGNYIGSSYARFKNTCLHNTFGNIFMSYSEILVTIVCGYEILHGRMSFGGFMAFMNAFWLTVGGLRTLIQKVPEVSRNSAIIERMKKFEDMPELALSSVASSGNIICENISFKYGDKEILSDLNFIIGKGEKIMMIGKNGSGKSTLANILSCFLIPSKGIVQTFPMSNVSACISPYYFIPGTVKDNINFNMCDDRYKNYLNVLVKDFGLDISMEKQPDELSAGQKKKLELIMGLMKEADLYIFDEPLANVDTSSKSKIMEHIFDRTKNKTLVVIMHGDEEFQKNFNKVIKL